MTYRELIYMCLDEIKQISNDSLITEDHVKFLANLYRYFLLYLKKIKEGITGLSTSNQLTICVDLQRTLAVPNTDVCNELLLKSDLRIPELMDSEHISMSGKLLFGTNISFVSKERFKFVGHNKWLKNIIYCCLGSDRHLYLKGANPLFKYLNQIQLTGIFEDSSKAAELSCSEENTTDSVCDPLDKEFPLDADLVPQLIELIVKELTAAAWRQKDDVNNSKDDLADLITYIAKNTKSDLQKKITE